jgi:hypothetical protein
MFILKPKVEFKLTVKLVQNKKKIKTGSGLNLKDKK